MSPFAAAAEIYLVNKELWSSQIPRVNALFVTIASIVLCPIWYVIFLGMILWSLRDLERIKISKRTHRIIYDPDVKAKFPLQRMVMAVTFVVFCPLWFLYFVDAVLGQFMKEIHDGRAAARDKVIERTRAAAEEGRLNSRFKSAVKRAAIMNAIASNGRVVAAVTVQPGADKLPTVLSEAASRGSLNGSDEVPSTLGEVELATPKKDDSVDGTQLPSLSPQGGLSPQLSRSEGSLDPRSRTLSQSSQRRLLRAVGTSQSILGSSTAKVANEVTINQKTFSFLPTEKRLVVSSTGVITDIFLYDIQDVMMCFFFILTGPIWFVSIFLVKMAEFLEETDPVKKSTWDKLRMYYTVSNNLRKATEAETAAKALHPGVGATATGGLLTMNLIRLNFKGRMGLFGRKANPFVRAIYGNEWKESPTYGIDDSPLSNAKIEFFLTDVNDLQLLVFDSDTRDSADAKTGSSGGGIGGAQARKKGVLMGSFTVNIKEWVANGRYEGEVNLLNREGIDVGDTIQLAVKISYPQREKKTSKVPEKVGVLFFYFDLLSFYFI
jgi:hypothetical protein